ncbi:MAG: glycosyltransferase family 39 protein [Anaerolineae bacterium]
MYLSRWKRWWSLLGVTVLAVLANGVILAGVSRWLTFVSGLVLACLLPGYLLARVVLPRRSVLDWGERVVLAIGMGFGGLILGTLLLHYLSGPLTVPLILTFFDGLVLLLTILLVCRGDEEKAPSGGVSPRYFLPLLGLVLAAAFLRFGNLGYSEFQGDESRAMLMAAGVVRGEDGILFLHKKGPVEILLPAVFYALDGTIEEFAARFPFALANVTGVVCVYVLTRRMFPDLPLAAPVAAGFLAVDGYMVAFGHIVQYQSVVFLMMALAAWCACVWYREGNIVLIVLAVSFVAVGVLAHYEAILVAPFVAWLFWRRGRNEGWRFSRWLQRAVVLSVAFAVVAGVFYVPFVLNPSFASTADYIVGQRVGGGVFHNNLGDFFYRATFYSSTYYISFLVLGLLVFAADRLLTWLRPAILGAPVLLVLVAGMAIAMFFPQVLVVGSLDLAILPFALTLVLLIASPRTTTEYRAVLLWFGVPALIALFLMQLPKTHVYTMFPAWAILVGVTLDRALSGIDRRVGRVLPAAGIRKAGLALAGVALLIVFGYYEYIVFVRHEPDLRRGYPETLPPFYLTFYRDDHPPVGGGGFGFPHRGGWKAIGALYAQGVLQGSYGANEETLTSSWYVRQAPWCRDAADYYFIASVIHDPESIPVNRVLREMYTVGRVWSDGQPVLMIYGRQAIDTIEDYDLAALEGVFDAAATPDVWLWALKDPTPRHHTDARLADRVRLLGFDVSPQVAAGEVLSLNLYWQVEAPFDRDYSVFTHVEVEGEGIRGQSDGIPVCGSLPTTKWQPGEVVVDGRTLLIDPATPPGEYPLLVGLYDAMTGERLRVSGSDANARGDTVYLGTVRVVSPVGVEGENLGRVPR